MISLPSGAASTSMVGPGRVGRVGQRLEQRDHRQRGHQRHRHEGGDHALVHARKLSQTAGCAAAGRGSAGATLARSAPGSLGSARAATGSVRGVRRSATPVERSRRRGSRVGRSGCSCSRAAPEPAYGLLAVDLAPALAADPAHPGHRHDGDDDRRHQPEQDLHPARVGTSVADMSEPTPVPARRTCARRRWSVDEVVAALDDDDVGRADPVRRPGARPRPRQGRRRARLHRAPLRAGPAARGLRAGRRGVRRARARRRAPGRHPGHRRRRGRGGHHVRAPRHLVRRVAAADRHPQGRGADLEAPAVQRRHRGVGRAHPDLCPEFGPRPGSSREPAYRGGHGRRAGRAPEPVQGHAVRAVLHRRHGRHGRAAACPTSTSSSASSSRCCSPTTGRSTGTSPSTWPARPSPSRPTRRPAGPAERRRRRGPARRPLARRDHRRSPPA